MACTKQTERKSNKGLPKATKGGKGGGGGVSSGRCGGGGSGSSDGNGNGGNGKGKVPSKHFRKQLENRPPTAAPKRKRPYVQAFQEMKKLVYGKVMYIKISGSKCRILTTLFKRPIIPHRHSEYL